MPRAALILAAVAGLLAGSLAHAVAENPSDTTVAAAGAHAVEVVAWLRIRPDRDRDQWAYDAERGTQAEVILFPSTLESALQQPGIADLESLSDEPNKVAWLRRTIQVTVPANSETLRVSMRGTNAHDAKKIVDAVTRAYLEHVGSPERIERHARRDMLDKKYKENMAEVRARLETFNNFARAVGSLDSAEVATQRSLLVDRLGTLQTALTQTQRDIIQIDSELAVIYAAEELNPDGGQDAMPEDSEPGGPARPGAGSVNPAVLRMRREILAKQLEQTSKELEIVKKDVTALGDTGTDLEALRNEIAQLQAETNQIGIQLALAEVEATQPRKPNRVELIEAATVVDAP